MSCAECISRAISASYALSTTPRYRPPKGCTLKERGVVPSPVRSMSLRKASPPFFSASRKRFLSGQNAHASPLPQGAASPQRMTSFKLPRPEEEGKKVRKARLE